MSNAPIRVEVVLTDTDAAIASMVSPGPAPPTTEMRTLPPDSLAARQIELAVAVEMHCGTVGSFQEHVTPALKAVREHPSYRPANTGGGDA